MNPKSTEQPDKLVSTQGFAAVIQKGTDGKKKLVLKSQRWYQYQINKFKDGEHVTLVVHNRRPKRTEAQNRYYWGAYLPLIAEETGHEIDELHELFKGKFLTKGIIEVLGEKVRIKGSSAKLSISEFSRYIMQIHELTGVPPPPTDSYDLDLTLKE